MTQVDTTTAAADRTSTQVITANLFQLSGGGLHVTYLNASGVSQLTYQDANRTLHFPAADIRKVDVPDLGTIVSVTLLLTVDSGSTTFSLLIPQVNLPNQPRASAPVTTDGITTFHRFSLVPVLNEGQREFYMVTPLTGTASFVIVQV